ncbi:solute carrier family 53 member 1-like isoform X2 [Bacillus rossius redtenbacheri]
MKSLLYDVVERAPSPESVEPEVLSRYYANFDENFFHFCDAELKKINTFFSEKLAEATRKLATLQNELQVSLASRTMGKPRAKLPSRKVQELKLAFSEFYLSIILLQNYQNLNFTGFRKILKKHDKLLAVDSGARWRLENVETSPIYTNKEIDRLISETENTFTHELESGDRQRAMKRLRVPPLGEQQSPWTTFKVGLFSGSFIILLLAVVLSAIFHEGGPDHLRVAFTLYRGPFVIVMFVFLMGVNVYGWRSSGVNHVLIFELDPRNHLSEQHLMEIAAILGVIWTLSLLSFLYSRSLSIPPFATPLALSIIMIVFLINPLRTFRHEARFWLMRIVGRILAAPFFPVAFADFWLADQFNSLVGVLLDGHFLVCFYFSTGDWLHVGEVGQCSSQSWVVRPIVNCLPAWFRFAQCLRRYRDSREAFPHLVNAGKYSTTFIVVVCSTLRAYHADEYPELYDNPYFYMWVLASVTSTAYTYTWDVRMDWGLFDTFSGENKFLREETVYSSTMFYYFAIVEDLVLRFMWALSFVLTHNGYVSGDIMTSIAICLEVFRRFLWNFFRLENEHLNNCGKFRAVRDISVAPLDASDHAHILRMMDELDGVDHRRKRRAGRKGKEDSHQLLMNDSLTSLGSGPRASTNL